MLGAWVRQSDTIPWTEKAIMWIEQLLKPHMNSLYINEQCWPRSSWDTDYFREMTSLTVLRYDILTTKEEVHRLC